MDEEEWRAVPGFPLYEASNLGRIRRNPLTPSHLPCEALSPGKRGRYRCVALMRESKVHYRLVHRVICLTFHGPAPSPRHEVAHGDNDGANNRADNLRWATRAENFADKRAHGTHRQGSSISWAKLTEKDIPEIRRRLASGDSPLKISQDFGVSTGAIGGIRTGRNWSHVA